MMRIMAAMIRNNCFINWCIRTSNQLYFRLRLLLFMWALVSLPTYKTMPMMKLVFLKMLPLRARFLYVISKNSSLSMLITPLNLLMMGLGWSQMTTPRKSYTSALFTLFWAANFSVRTASPSKFIVSKKAEFACTLISSKSAGISLLLKTVTISPTRSSYCAFCTKPSFP